MCMRQAPHALHAHDSRCSLLTRKTLVWVVWTGHEANSEESRDNNSDNVVAGVVVIPDCQG